MKQSTSGPGAKRFDPVRAAAVEAMVLVDNGQLIEPSIEHVTDRKDFRPLDIRFLKQLVHGSVKMRRRLDHEIKFYLARPGVSLPLKLSNILRLGFFQLRFTDRIPDAAAVSESVYLARYMLDKPRANLVNAVLRASLREPEKVRFTDPDHNPVKYLADFYSFPDYFVSYCHKEFGFERTKLLLSSYNDVSQITYRVNYLKTKPADVVALLDEHDIPHAPGTVLPEFIHILQNGIPLEEELLKSGKVLIQDESAGMAGRLLNPKPGDSVVDLTAAPGGKATHLAIRMRNKGRVTAVDKSATRLQRVVENVERLGIKIISPVVSEMGKFQGGPFDRVLLDPPCSGWGTARRHADLRWSKQVTDIGSLAKVQKRMIDRAAKLVKPGGVLVYSTCTIIRAENDQIVEEFLLRNSNFEIESAAEFFGPEFVNDRGFVKTYPNIEYFDGAFAARLRRKPE